MSYMHPVNEELTVVFCFRHPTSGAALTGIAASIDVTVYDEAYESFETGNPTEIAKGLYYYTFTPDADGVWIPIAEYEGVSPVLTAPKAFLVGTDLETLISAIKAKTDTIDWTDITAVLADTDEIQAALADGGFIDLLIDAIKAKTDSIGASVATAGEYDTEAAHLDADISAIIQQVALTGHPANSIGKILFDFYNTRLGATRCGYLDNLSAGAAALEATLTAIKGDGWTDETLKALKDGGDSGYTNITGTGFTPDTHSLKNLYDLLVAIPTTTEAEGYVENAEDGGDLTHDITTGNDQTETTVFEIAKTGIYALSVFFDLDVLETAVEGGTITIRLYNKIDGTNYSDIPTAHLTYTVGSENEYPSIEANMLHGYSKVTIECSDDVTETRTIVYRTITRDLGA